MWQALGLFLTLIATAGAAIAAGISARAAERAIEKSDEILAHSEEASERELRAYLTVPEAVADLHQTGPDGLWYALIKVRNGGQTPAYKVKTTFSIEGDKYPLAKGIPAIPEHPAEGVAESIIGPGEDVNMRLQLKDPPNDAKLRALMLGEAIIWVVGRVSYEDIFGDHQWLTVRMFTGGKDAPGTSGEFRPYETGNEAGEQGRYKRRRRSA